MSLWIASCRNCGVTVAALRAKDFGPPVGWCNNCRRWTRWAWRIENEAVPVLRGLRAATGGAWIQKTEDAYDPARDNLPLVPRGV